MWRMRQRKVRSVVISHRMRTGIPLAGKNAQDCWRHCNPRTPTMVAKPKPAPLACTISALASLALAAFGASEAAAQDSRGAPEAATGWGGNVLARSKSHMVASANPMATEAGLEILRAGGSAAD